jgi:hypothetical protein
VCLLIHNLDLQVRQALLLPSEQCILYFGA